MACILLSSPRVSERHLDSSGIVAIAELTAPASPRLVREALAAASQVRVGAGHAECGVLLALGPREMAALFETRLEGEPDERLAICTLVADASLTPSAARDVRDAASRLLRAEGLAALAWRVVEGEHHSWCEQLLIGRGHRARGELDLALAAARESLQARYA